MPKSWKYDCRRRATPPHPRDTGHLKQGDGKREIGRLPRHRRRIIRWLLARGKQTKEKSKPKLLKKWPKWIPKPTRHKSCVADAFSERFGAAVGSQLLDFGSQNLQNITKTASKINEKSRLRRGYVFEAFLGGLGYEKGAHHPLRAGPFWEPFSLKIEKMASKKASKNRCRKSIKN